MRLSTLCRLLGLGVTLAMFNQTPAAAASDVYFYPSKGWRVASTMNAGQNICTARAQFNNGFVLSFKGSDKWVESLNIDLKQSALNKGKSYPITLSVPGASSKKLSAHALSDNDLTIKMTGNKDLYTMIRDSSVFDLSIDGNEFRFYMVGFADKAKSFERCMAGKPAQNGDALHVTTKAMPNESVKMETQETNALANPNASKTPVVMAKTAPKAALSVSTLATANTAPASAAPVKPVSSEMLPLPNAPQNRDAINAATKTDDAKPMREKMVPAPAVPVIDVTAAAKPITPSAEIKTTHQNYKTDVKVQKTSRSVEADLTGVPTRKSRAAMSPTAHEKIASKKSDSKELAKLKRMIADLQAENKALNNEVRQISSESREEGDTIETRNWNLERATMRYHEAERQLKKMGQQIQQERSKCMLETQELEAMLFDPQVTEAQQSAHLADLKRQLEDAQRQLEAHR